MPGKTHLLASLGFLGALSCTLLNTRSIAEAPPTAREDFAWSGTIESQGETHGSPKKTTTSERRHKRMERVVTMEPFQSFLAVVDQPDIRIEHKIIADEVLRMVPAQCRDNVQNFYVRYDHPAQRGLAGKASIILTGNVSDDEFRALLIHELFGHVIDLGCLIGNEESGPSGFKDGKEVIYRNDPSVEFYVISWTSEKIRHAGSLSADFVSGYAASDAFEDFAESVTYYLLQEQAFRVRAEKNSILARKLAWLEATLFTKKKTIAQGAHVWSGTVPWDVTKLPYVWTGL